MAKKPTRGGKRKGSGRKPLSGKALGQYSVQLSDAQVAKAISAGGDNLAAGVRRLIDAATIISPIEPHP